jgi:hypothetical protein
MSACTARSVPFQTGAAQIRNAQSCASNPRQAVREFHAAVAQPDMALVVFFCSNAYDPDALSSELREVFSGVQVVGCSTAGEIGPYGYRTRSIAGASFPAGSFTAVSGGLDGLATFTAAEGQTFARALLQKLETQASGANAENSFGILLIDGLSGREELVTHAFQGALGQVPMIGGSAGDGLDFGSTRVYFDGHFRSDRAALVLATTPLPFQLFQTQHYVATSERFVVTAADPAHRLVGEINGLPAANEYARMLGVAPAQLSARHFAAHPVVVTVNGRPYVRSIQQADAQGNLRFLSAVEEGMVLRLAKGANLVTNLEEAFARIRAQIGEPQLVLGCDCILRRLEIVEGRMEDRVGELMARNNAVGFNTYGEQFQGVHVNQTLVGIAIGAEDADAAGH